MTRFKIGAVSLLLLAACKGLPFFGGHSQPAPSRGAVKGTGRQGVQVPPRTVMEVQDIQYDGWTLSGRVLVSPEGGQLRLDRRLIPTIHVELKYVSDCKYGAVASIRADLLAPLARPEDLLILEPGYWYGTTVRFGLFDEHFTGLGPECVEADIFLRSFDHELVARQRIRAVRPASVDGGTQSDEGGTLEVPASPPDAGTP
ncbi:hypothetical protein F0U61_51880 [Archangium violaceum]|uniref:hypothetical protein n=1 Tax=Archangium violaceum TaxID=83451 RepID=UPI002B2BE6B8|nr:hypothetical protein F0U61_51880 [Archangium violaceum]